MRRRDLLVVAGALLAAPLVRAQGGRIHRVGMIYIPAEAEVQGVEAAFLRAMRNYGYTVGRNLAYDARYAGGDFGKVPELVDELVALNPDALVGFESVAQVMKAKTSTIPIVLTNSTDPVTLGMAGSLAKPGGNVTGISTQWEMFPAKHVEIVREIVSRLARVGLLVDTSAPGAKVGEKFVRNAVAKIGAVLVPYYVKNHAEIGQAVDRMDKDRVEVLLFLSSGVIYSFRKQLYDRMLRLRIPLVTSIPSMADEGALLAYGPNFEQAFRDAARYVDRILKGAKPGELPIEQPTKFEMVINLKTAKVLGLTIPQSLLLRADRVIE